MYATVSLHAYKQAAATNENAQLFVSNISEGEKKRLKIEEVAPKQNEISILYSGRFSATIFSII